MPGVGEAREAALEICEVLEVREAPEVREARQAPEVRESPEARGVLGAGESLGNADAGADRAGGVGRGGGAGWREGPEPLGPTSLTWKYFGDWRGVLLAPWAGAMQNMHPQLGAGVAEHSRFFEERWERLLRSLYPIGGVVYDGPRAAGTARQVRGYHDTIKGVDARGRPYHALDPDTFYWAHSTFFVLTLLVADRLGPGLSEAEKRQLFDEHVQWWRMYGMSMRPVPASWEDFQVYWNRMAEEVLEDNTPARDVLDIARIAKPPALRLLPDVLWRVVRGLQARLTVWLTVGLFPPAVRRRLGYVWTVRDERRLRRVGRLVHHGWRLVPPSRRYHPRARAGWEREAGRRSAGAPPVETPARNLPLPDERDLPQHYSPRV